MIADDSPTIDCTVQIKEMEDNLKKLETLGQSIKSTGGIVATTLKEIADCAEKVQGECH